VTDLAGLELFEGFAAAELAEVAARLRPLELAAGETLFEQGELGDAAYVVVHGAIEVARHGSRIAVAGPGQMLGELSLIDAGPRTATCVALADSSLLELGEVAFDELFRSPAGLKFVQAVNRTLIAAQHRTDERVETRRGHSS
jgi:CRP/FNR family cyclic AMP-dependent transcriptional regulator